MNLTSRELLERGIDRMRTFCRVNNLEPPHVEVIPKAAWVFEHCAFWRPNYVHICLENCARPAPVVECRNWNWPGNATDREPYGVICHELGHCADFYGSDPSERGSYWGLLSKHLRAESGEKPLTSYCPNDAEWFAEHFRLFVTNHAMLELLRPKTHAIFLKRWQPVSAADWRAELTSTVPPRIIRAVENKAPKKK